MNPFISSHISTIIEDIRLLEAIVTAPLGLYSDIKMLRESLPSDEATELSRDQLQERRTTYSSMTDTHSSIALKTIDSLGDAISIIEQIKGDPEISKLQTEWSPRAVMVLDRAKQKVATDIRSEYAKKVTGLYIIVDPEATKGRPVDQVALAALKGGTKIVQLRDKTRDKGEVIPIAREIRQMCDDFGALFVMNDDADVARLSGAHGLHVGQSDMNVGDARDILLTHQIIGTSNGSMDEAMQSQADGVDYIAVGAVYATTTMGKSGRTALGPELVREIKDRVSQPIVAIGGINESNIKEVVQAGADCLCIVSAVTFADDPQSAAARLTEMIEGAK